VESGAEYYFHSSGIETIQNASQNFTNYQRFSMKKLCVFLFFISICHLLRAQPVNWTWMGGDSTRIVFDVYGNRRVFAPLNRPGAISPLTSFKGKDGNFYFFGGSTLVLLNGFTTVQVPTCALWKYSPLLNQWAMPTGSNGSNPSINTGGEVLGVEGVFSPLNSPGYLSSMSANWIDSAGNWWLFGGKTGYRDFGTKCTLWKYDLKLSQWMVVKGCSDDSWATYGVQGVGDISNSPGARQSMLAWKDRKGRFYIFGGYIAGRMYHADVWMYDPASNQWTWQNGKKSAPGESSPTVRGASGVFAPENTPGTSTGGSIVLDSAGSNDVVRLSVFGETWLYSNSLNQWAWISKDSPVSAPTIVRHYGTSGVPSVLNNPGERSGATTWSDETYTWVYGGNTYSSTQNGSLSDLWKYNKQTTEWTWVSGDSTVNRAPVYGPKGIPSSSAMPGGRNAPLTWIDTQGNMWLLGGTVQEQLPRSGLTTVRLNDLWKLSMATNAALPSTLGGFAAVVREGKAQLRWNTTQEHNSKAFNIERSTDGIRFSLIGTIPAAGNSNRDINYNYTDNSPVPGRSYYRLQSLNSDDTFDYSKTVSLTFSQAAFDFSIYNPVTNLLRIELQLAEPATVNIQVKNVLGRLEITRELQAAKGRSMLTFPAESLSQGVHLVTVIERNRKITKRFVRL
jgi:hypothetical protein